MAGKTLFPTEGSPPGISAGVPFQVDAFTYVEQVTPPFLATSRLKRIADVTQSIIAPGAAGAPNSFVLGEDAEDSPTGDRAVLIGYQLRQNNGGAGQAFDQILIGNRIRLPALATNSQNAVYIGSGFTFTGFVAANSFGNNVVIGPNPVVAALNAAGGDASNVVMIGSSVACASGKCVIIGSTASSSDGEATVLGNGASGALQCFAGGSLAQASAHAVAVGRSSVAAADSVSLGTFATNAGGDSGVTVGRSATTAGATGAMAFGRDATNTVSHWALFGSRTYPVNTLRVGAGLNDATGDIEYTWQTTDVFGGAGNNLAGNSLVIAAGVGTGNNANASNRGIDFRVGILGAAGSVQQVYTSVFAMRHSDLNAALWGGLTAPFSGGKGVLFIANATTNPTVAAVAGGGILSVQGGNLHFLNSAGVDTALTPAAGGGGNVTTAGLTIGTLPVASTATALVNSPVSQVAGGIQVAGGVITSDSPNTLDLFTVIDAVRMVPAGVVTLGVARAASAPDGINQVFPGATNSVSLGGPTRAFNGLYIVGAAAITLTSQTVTVGAALGTLTNAPTAGNPTGYLRVNINGAVGKIPYWV